MSGERIVDPKDLVQEDQAAEYFKAYSGFAKTLRTWLVAYGIGLPVLILTQNAALAALNTAHSTRLVGRLLLIGVALQVGVAALNKQVMYGCYYYETPNGRSARFQFPYKAARAISEWYWIDLIVDIATLILFGFATYFCFDALAK
jgi:hypothetical protein